MKLDLETIFYIIIAGISIISGMRANKKKKAQETQPEPDTSLEEELRRMAERMMGKKEEETTQPTETPTQRQETVRPRPFVYDTYETIESDENRYRELVDLETAQPMPVVNYSEMDIRRREAEQAAMASPENYEARAVEALQHGQELHTVVDNRRNKENKVIDHIDFLSDFDARKAVIYAEIMKRPEW